MFRCSPSRIKIAKGGESCFQDLQVKGMKGCLGALTWATLGALTWATLGSVTARPAQASYQGHHRLLGASAFLKMNVPPLLKLQQQEQCGLAFSSDPNCSLDVSDEDAADIGHRMWVNECGGTVEGLTNWNNGEEFASLGIGHTIWYPAGVRGPFQESFPLLVRFLVDQEGVAVPAWLTYPGLPAIVTPCPWRSKAEFDAAQASPQMVELRTLLAATVKEQCHFLARRFQEALPKVLLKAPVEEREVLSARFYSVAAEHLGLYPLMDYTNFKGEGTSDVEKYRGEGWGLLQVLQNMEDTEPDGSMHAKQAFVASAKQMLTRRVENSPPERGERRWLLGWFNRLDTYLT